MATVNYDYSDVFGFEPPQFYEEQEISDELFSLSGANTAALSNNWELTPIDTLAGDNRDPLDKLSRMGLADLVHHDEDQVVTLVLHTQKNKKFLFQFDVFEIDNVKMYSHL